MIEHSVVLRRGTVAALLALFATLLPHRPVLADAPPGVTLLTERAAALEGEIATLLQRRPDASPEQGPLLDVQTDLRIIARWFLTRAAEAPPGSDLHASGYLRARNVLALLRAFTPRDDGDDDDDGNPGAPLTP